MDVRKGNSSGSSTLHLDSLLGGGIVIGSSIDKKRAGIGIKEMVIVQVIITRWCGWASSAGSRINTS